MEKISIIIPVYNVKKYLNDCIQSVINQTYNNLEIILIDDGSTDGSGDYCDEIAKKDSRIFVYHKTNGGLSEARNVGIKISTGKYITFIDSDDYIENLYIETLYNSLIEYKADIAIVNKYHLKDNEKIVHLANSKELFRVFDTKMILESMYSRENNFISTLTMAQLKLYRKELFSDIEFPIGKKYEDSFTTYKTYIEANRIVFVNRPLYAYRFRSGSIIRSGYQLSNLDVLEMYEERLEYFRERGYDLLSTKYHYCIAIANQKELLKKHFPNNPKIYKLDSQFREIYCDILNELPFKKRIKLGIIRFLPFIKRLKYQFIESR
ncbi:TPA: glycosyltransferase family 2 protein [Streptococcus agalactiae]